MSEPFIRVGDLRKTFMMGQNAVHALDGVNLEIPACTLSVIMGPSGSGKSTLLHLVGGLDRPTAGSISVDGQQIEILDENALAVFRRRTVGFVFQSFNLVSSMTALENVIFPMRFAGVARKERYKRAVQALERVGLEDRAAHRPSELSGGQQQRVAIARALINDPQLILADEPTGNLDTASGASIMQLLSELHKSGRTVVVVTHDARMIQFSTHTIELLDGRVVNGNALLASTPLTTDQIEAAQTGRTEGNPQ
jgi:putative ABC transport system ATP-binding protein